MINNETWFKQWFDSSFYHQLYAKRDEREASDLIDHLLAVLEPNEFSFMLDLGCGSGRHSKYLASKGFDVTGVDLAASSIRQAKKHESPNLKFYRHDMRMPLGKNYFDYVFNFFTSFGYFKNDSENLKVIGNISETLKDDGILVMDYLNTKYSEDRLIPFEEKEIDGVHYHISRWSDERFFYKKIRIDDMHEYVEQVTKFNLKDFEYMFEVNGLKLENVYGNYGLNEYDETDSPRLIMLSRK